MTTTTQDPTPESVWAFLREIAQQQKETERQMKETERILQAALQEFRQGLKKAEALFTTQWGRLMESLVSGALVELFNRRDILVEDISTRIKGSRRGRSYEFDIIAHNGPKIVIVEVKTTLRPDDVRKFLGKLEDAKILMPRYEKNTIHGAVAWLRTDADADKMAVNRGLFSIRAVGDSASITNAPNFEPTPF
uniref:DUF3782 domain-containing protein n=1 Tax=Candidatus Kentrum eta TaxID=2126337 RepID=A0A450V8E8_9GAMM|nr:MAG: hypothetical protein BECKH772A_GA0070896_102132 [Candidatus Kentron sp. H]VFK01224.1 MAG: hypothetical protein BECKH772B_GA0070898_102223 [Candidatus Kentron sp. H]VFK04842.1 MAG: hypothetical protein BECKH772C_GA0070978_102142 [Candidatus Kentron sp. H]